MSADELLPDGLGDGYSDDAIPNPPAAEGQYSDDEPAPKQAPANDQYSDDAVPANAAPGNEGYSDEEPAPKPAPANDGYSEEDEPPKPPPANHGYSEEDSPPQKVAPTNARYSEEDSPQKVAPANAGYSDDEAPKAAAPASPDDEAAPTDIADAATLDSLSVIPVLEKIMVHVDRVLEILPDLFISSADVFELSKNLRSMRALLLRATLESTSLAALQKQCSREWNVFAAALEQRVKADEAPNVQAFCETKLPLIGRVIEAIGAKQSTFEKDAVKNSAFESLAAAFKDCEDALGGDIVVFQRALRNLEARFLNSESLLVFAAPPEQRESLKKTAVNFLALMHQFTGNAQRAVSQRAIVAAVARQARNAVTQLFARARPFEHRPAKPSLNTTTGQPKKTTYKRPLLPKHTPPVRGRLFEQPRKVSAMPKQTRSLHS